LTAETGHAGELAKSRKHEAFDLIRIGRLIRSILWAASRDFRRLKRPGAVRTLAIQTQRKAPSSSTRLHYSSVISITTSAHLPRD
jgi:hypothetical protein